MGVKSFIFSGHRGHPLLAVPVLSTTTVMGIRGVTDNVSVTAPIPITPGLQHSFLVLPKCPLTCYIGTFGVSKLTATLRCSPEEISLFLPFETAHLCCLTEPTSNVSPESQEAKYVSVLLEHDSVTLVKSTCLNPATLLPLPDTAQEHDCLQVLAEVVGIHPDLTTEPLQNPDLSLWTDGPSYIQNGIRFTGFANCLGKVSYFETTPSPVFSTSS